MARLLADENFPLPVVEELRRLGHDVRMLQEEGWANQRVPDEDVLMLAAAAGRAVLTLNRRHFLQLHEASREHAGLIVCTLDLDFVGQAERIHQALAPRATLAGTLLRVNRPA